MSDAAIEARFRQMRDTAGSIFRYTLDQASIANGFSRHVHCERGVMRVCEDLYDLHSYSRVVVISFGKAAHTMVEALVAQVGISVEGIVASSVQPASQLRGFRYFRGGHPTPNQESIQAAGAMLRGLESQNANSLAIFLLSGGGSSIVEKPIDDEISLDDLVATYRVLVHSGAPIAEINAIRKHLSAVKGGRLAKAASPAQQVSLLVSDVPANTPDALASGPTMPDSTSVEDCYRLAQKYDLVSQFPASVRELFERHALEETPKSDEPAFQRSRWWTLLSNQTAVEEASIAAERAGFLVRVDNTCDDWDYANAADYLLQKARELRRQFSPLCLISGGEVTVKVVNGGVGGRNLQFALACAGKVKNEPVCVLSAGTDGVDGNSPAAGAVVDGSTVERATEAGFDTRKVLERFDAYPLFDAIGDAIETGPTGNNLRDLRIVLAY
jgi:glycerate 2-kinase